jgi:hypothetical protein
MTEKVDERIKQVVAGKYGGEVPYVLRSVVFLFVVILKLIWLLKS